MNTYLVVLEDKDGMGGSFMQWRLKHSSGKRTRKNFKLICSIYDMNRVLFYKNNWMGLDNEMFNSYFFWRGLTRMDAWNFSP